MKVQDKKFARCLEFRLIKTDTIKGIEKAEWYQARGWRIATVGFNTVQLFRSKNKNIKNLKEI